MARSVFSSAVSAARAYDRAVKAEERENRRLIRESERELKNAQRKLAVAYAEERQDEVDALNDDLALQLITLENLLLDGLANGPSFNWQRLRRTPNEHELDRVPELRLPEKPIAALFVPDEMGVIARLLPGGTRRHERRAETLRNEYDQLASRYQVVLDKRRVAFSQLERQAAEFNQQVDAFQSAYQSGDSEAVTGFVERILEDVEFPSGFHQEFGLAYVGESRLLVVEYRLPILDDIIPTVQAYRYVKTRDRIDEKVAAAKARNSLYASVIAQVVLQSINEIFRCDEDEIIDAVAFNGVVQTINPATGMSVRPCLISIRTTREQIRNIDLRNVDPTACIKGLNAEVSRSPADLAPVRPIVEFDMSDPRFVEEGDVISGLDARPNLMALTPNEFETLITNLFQKMGLETKQTQASRDGGVDCVAFDQRPIVGGKVVIQAKRYRNTVGVSAVRDLFGTLQNEGASKGILVTTSGYGKAAFEFADGKPIELISGSHLIHMLKEHADLDVRILMPDA